MRSSCVQQSCERSVWFLLIETALALRQTTERHLNINGVGLTPGEIRTLDCVMRNRSMRQVALAERMCVEPMTLSVYLDRLESFQLIERRRDPSDRRLRLIEPTPRSAELVADIQPIFSNLFEEMTTGVSAAQLRAFQKVLQSIHSNLSGEPSE